jgi:hypothetical protein
MVTAKPVRSDVITSAVLKSWSNSASAVAVTIDASSVGSVGWRRSEP